MKKRRKAPHGRIALTAMVLAVTLVLLGTLQIMKNDNTGFAEALADFLGRVFGTK